jgi:hypothetical protein
MKVVCFTRGVTVATYHCELEPRANEEEEVEVALVGCWELELVRRWRRAT